jgi:hypothetical protein
MTRLTLLALLFAAQAATAADGYTLVLGHDPDDDTDMAALQAKWNWDRKWFEAGDWHVAGYWEATLGHWRGDGAGARNLWDVGLTPVFRLQPNGGKTGLYLEAGIGAHVLSATRINNNRRFGGSLSFGEHIGFGATFGERGQYDLGYRFQHLSNADLADPNDGINFHQVRFTYNY